MKLRELIPAAQARHMAGVLWATYVAAMTVLAAAELRLNRWRKR